MDIIVIYDSSDAQSYLAGVMVGGYNQSAVISYIDTFGKDAAAISAAINALDGDQDHLYTAVTVHDTTGVITDAQQALAVGKLAVAENVTVWTTTDRSAAVDRVMQAWNTLTSSKTAPRSIYSMGDLLSRLTDAQEADGLYLEYAIPSLYNAVDSNDAPDTTIVRDVYSIIDKGMLGVGINTVINGNLSMPITDDRILDRIIQEGECAYKSQSNLWVDVNFTVVDGSAAAIEAATITLDGQSGTTDASGEATIENVAVGTDLYYTVTKTGYITKTGTVDVANGLDVDVAATLISASTVTVTVVDASDGTTPLENAVVIAGDASGQVTGTTSALGVVDLVLGYDDDVPVSAALTDYTSNAGVLTVDGATETLTIQLTHV